jgi:NADH-quinone oxidoreductase subunit L
MFAIHYIVFLPLIASFLTGFFHRLMGRTVSVILPCVAMVIAAGLSAFQFWFEMDWHGNEPATHLLTWISSGDFNISWALRVDQLTATMLVVVTWVSAIVHLYSIGYMHDDEHQPRFMSYLSLFTFAMLMLVTADNLLQMFFGWEGVGLASYLLIGFWNQKNSANAAAMKAFIVNRVGDFGFALGIMLTFWLVGSLNFGDIFAKVNDLHGVGFMFWGHHFDALTLATFLLFIGAMGKSAQLGLHTWLPDAMEGPTPVSALIHAATMVTAGVFMVARLSPMFAAAPDTLAFVTIVGALTAFSAAFMALTQNDIKRVIAYSTMSQLGYMFIALGVGAYGAAIFHLATHAFFKALLFLGAGQVIHALHHEQDLRKMGGVWKKIPITYAYMWIGNLALAGIPFFAGYYSKDMILEATFAAGPGLGHMAYWLGVIAAFMTAFYSWRLLWLAFHGKPRMDHHTFEHAHEAPKIMWIPLLVLAAGAIFSGALGYYYFVGEGRVDFWDGSLVVGEHDILHLAHEDPSWAVFFPTEVGILGIALGIFLYGFKTQIPGRIATIFKPLYKLSLNKFYVDEIYNLLFVKPAWIIGRFFSQRGDRDIIDRFGPDGAASTSQRIAARLSRIQTGYIFNYAAVMVTGVVLLLTYLLWTLGS